MELGKGKKEDGPLIEDNFVKDLVREQVRRYHGEIWRRNGFSSDPFTIQIEDKRVI